MTRITPIDVLPILNRADDLRLPDAVTVNYGPIGLLSHFFLAADQHVRERGVRLKVRHDMEELLRLNRREAQLGNWYPVVASFDCEAVELTPENSYWISGVNGAGETVIAQAAHVYQWHDSSLADHVGELVYADPEMAARCVNYSETARLTRGTVYFGGSTWVRPDYRRLGLGQMLPRISRAYGAATWGTEWSVAFVKREDIEKGMHTAYGYSDVSYGVKLPGSTLGDIDCGICRQNSLDLLASCERFIAKRTQASTAVAA